MKLFDLIRYAPDGEGGADAPPPQDTPVEEPAKEAEAPPPEAPKDDKPADDVPAVEPLTVEALQLPEGFERNDAAMEKFVGVMNDEKLSPAERANALLGMYAELQTSASERVSQEFADTREKWTDEIKADPKIGGDKLDATVGRIGKLIDQFGSKELRDALDLTGAGDNPHVVRFFHAMAEKLTEPDPVPGAVPGVSSKPLAERLFSGSSN